MLRAKKITQKSKNAGSVEVTTPQFGGSSYISFDGISNMRQIKVKFSFKTHDIHGLLFHLTDGESSITISVEEGRVVYR